uniref:Transcriptional regulator TetR family n=1 Tax=uncultured Verrucomicrobiota bacterium TaxID=156588 RepID=D2DXP6_9BACT|nr:transcriptional regulator TetR family [uncultured Verrucomicrobiota bacterium]
MTTAGAASSSTTRQRLLDAAFSVCAQRGLHAATTREIADAAKVNEVTLFRHFGSKEKLIAALFERSVSAQIQSLSDSESDGDDLARDLLRYARKFNQMLFEHEPLIRTLIGEAHRYPEAAREVIQDSVKPMRRRLIAYLRAAQEAGAVRTGLKLAPAVDAFTGMLLSGMLRRTGNPKCLEYAHESFLMTCVELFVCGISAPQPKAKSAHPK